MIRVYDDAGNVIATHEHKGEFKEFWGVTELNPPRTHESPFQFNKRSQHFIGAYDEPLSVAKIALECELIGRR